jgi:uncharacterized protein
LRLIHEYYRRFRSIDFVNIKILKALDRVLTLLDEETQDSAAEARQGKNFYTFYRSKEELPNGTIANAVQTGMVKTGFRPSDSPNELPYNIPGNAMLASYLRLVATEVLSEIPSSSVFSSWSKRLSQKMQKYGFSITAAIYNHGVVSPGGVSIFAYEVDGKGGYRAYDDGNLPSLLSLPYLNFLGLSDGIYQNTRKFMLSSQNKYFYSLGNISGIGSSHTPTYYIWHLALITEIMTSTSKSEIQHSLNNLLISAKNNLMHESFYMYEPMKITRDWFAWANSYFGEMIAYLTETYPDVLQ